MEERREVLELPPSWTLFEHAPAVGGNALRLAVAVGLEQSANAAEAGGLEVRRRGGQGRAAMSATERMGTSQVIRSR